MKSTFQFLTSSGHDVWALLRRRAPGIRRALLAWFRREARDLPWRRTRDPYAVWVSEIMLQQTRVETVIPYYERFMSAFPTVQALARAPEDRLMKAWEGLGYYSRARNLQHAAREIANERGGRLPKTAEEWRVLPGVGRYTAAAIASITRGERVAVLDGNVKRVLARVLDIEDCVDEARVADAMWEAAQRLMPRDAPGDHNQAMMELGATVCVPRTPRCGECPLRRLCAARTLGLAAHLPVRREKKPRPHRHIVAAVVRRRGDGAYLLGKRPAEKMLGGLWEFPGGKVEAGESHEAALARELREELGIEVRVGRRIASVDHAYSHFEITLHVHECEHLRGEPHPHWHSELRWVPRAEFEELAFPAADLKFMHLLE